MIFDLILILFKVLQEEKPNQLSYNWIEMIRNRLPEELKSISDDEILDHIYMLFNLGIIKQAFNKSHMNSSWISLTKYGRQCIAENNITLYDYDNQIQKLKDNINKYKTLDETIEIYFAESLRTFYNNNFLASVILIGGASEKLILLLCDSIISHIEKQSRTVNSDLRNNSISRKFNALKNHIISNKGTIPIEFYDGLENRLVAVFENIRLSRNDVGHPEINYKYIDRDAAQAHLLLFSGYCELVYKLIHWFDNN